ncbi:hypothetical protein [Algoriphagus aquimarinus]|uniref:Secreted protein n=1 Tax=Algoriphagus aquimarinus TaxID=237018 RepID=A0A5C7A8T9_9BACT|nr:hypothetical protein [Algoriphagus aquimarinus]TXE01855.1 hypothetical protein ESV85_21935 [Algoriphagus aquimarinus]
MKSITKMLPVLGLVLGATMAMSMNFANPAPMNEYAIDPDDPDEYINVTDLTLGTHYTCSSTGACLYDAPDGNVIRNGTFAWKP